MHAPKAPKAPKAEKQKDATEQKLKNANKRTKIKNALKKNLRGGKSLIRLFAFLCFLGARRKRQQKKEGRKKRKVPTK